MLINRQKAAYKQFKKGYVLVDSYRRGGKTAFLQYIVEQNPDKKIGIFAPFYTWYAMNFKKYKNCRYLDFKAPILLGDEYVLSRIDGKKIACVVTGLPKVTKWTISNSHWMIKVAKKGLSKKAFQSEFGVYLKKK